MRNSRDMFAGFTLIETLVALVVLSVGLLGIASLYVVSLQSSGGAIYRFKAINYASDLADRIRANPSASDTYVAGVGANGNPCITGNSCSATDMATYDLYLWQTEVQAQLPKGQTKITCLQNPCFVAGAVSNLSIEIDWYEPKAQSSQSYTLNLQI